MSRLPIFGLSAAMVLVLAGVAIVFWPASLIVAGLGLGAVCLLTDDGKGRGGSGT